MDVSQCAVLELARTYVVSSSLLTELVGLSESVVKPYSARASRNTGGKPPSALGQRLRLQLQRRRSLLLSYVRMVWRSWSQQVYVNDIDIS
jgi:hypothetical protein